MVYKLEQRQVYYNFDEGDDGVEEDNWGDSDTAVAVKWAVAGAILITLMLWLVLGRIHAQKRIKRGVAPMAYHRFLLPRKQRANFNPRPMYAYNGEGHGGEGDPLQAYPPPPPAYDTHHPPPPVYQPPEGESKVNSAQDRAAPPPGPPPGHPVLAESSNAMQSTPVTQPMANDEDRRAHQHVQSVKLGLISRLNPFK